MRLERRVLEREGFMQYFEKQGNALIFRQDGETVRVEPWQKDSLRVRGTLLSEIEEGSIALLDPEPVEAEIELVDELKATIKNGKIQAVLELQPWGQKLRITFLNQKGEVLLSEIANGGALCLRAHDYRALKGGAYQLKVSFDSNPDEKIYGMGQYQQERMNLKGCNLELAHRNSQASIPYRLPSAHIASVSWISPPAPGAVRSKIPKISGGSTHRPKMENRDFSWPGAGFF